MRGPSPPHASLPRCWQAALPLAPLVPDRTYNLRLLLPGGPLGSAVHLYVSVVLSGAAAAGRRHLRVHMAAAPQLLQARLAESAAAVLGELVPPGKGAGWRRTFPKAH